MKTALVTGASGFLGGYVVREFLRAGWKVLATGSAAPENAGLPAGVAYEALQLPDKRLDEAIRAIQPDVCVHCAGRASVADSMQHPDDDFASGVVLTAGLLEALRLEAPGCRMIFLSSAAVYGEPSRLPVAEDAPTHPLSPYGYHKRMCELLVEQYARVHGVRGCSARIFSAYGAGLRRQILWELCSQFAATGRAILQGTGRESRDFIHATDVARALRVVAERADCQGEVINFASGVEVSIAELAAELGLHFGAGDAVSFRGAQRVGDPQNWRADVTRLHEMGFVPAVSFPDGIASMATWAKTLLQ